MNMYKKNEGYQIRNDGIYFLTMTVINWLDLFTRQSYRDIILDSFKFCQHYKGLEIYGFVIMSNHVHLIAAIPGGSIGNVIGDIKQFTCKQIIKTIHEEPESRRKWLLDQFSFAGCLNNRNSHYQLRIQGNHPIELNTNFLQMQKLDYIHDNPVKAGIVYRPEDYVYSSASNYAGLGGIMEVKFLE